MSRWIKPRIYTCSKCQKTYEQGNTACLVIHIGDGCCHYGDKFIHDPAKDQHDLGQDHHIQR